MHGVTFLTSRPFLRLKSRATTVLAGHGVQPKKQISSSVFKPLPNTVEIQKNPHTNLPLYKISSIEEKRKILSISKDQTDMTVLLKMGINVIGTFQLPLGVATKFETFLPLALEEPSVIAGASGRAGLLSFSYQKIDTTLKVICEVPIAALAKGDKDGMWYAERLLKGFKLAKHVPKRAVTHNKGMDNAIGPLLLALGLQSSNVSSLLHFISRNKGIHPKTGAPQYGPANNWELTETNLLRGSIEFPIIELPKDIDLSKHQGVQISRHLANIGEDDSLKLTRLVGSVALAQNLAALLSLASKVGISGNHMPFHQSSENAKASIVQNPLSMLSPPNNIARVNLQALAQKLNIKDYQTLIDTTSEDTLVSMIEQGIGALRLPLSVFPLKMDGKDCFVPWAGPLKSDTLLEFLNLVNSVGTLSTEAPLPLIEGQVQVEFNNQSKLSPKELQRYIQDNWKDYQSRIIQRDKSTDKSDRPGKLERMEKRGGFRPDISVTQFGKSSAVIHFSLNPDKAMGANLIDRAAEIFGELLEEDLSINSIFRILTNDHSNCIAKGKLTLPNSTFISKKDSTGSHTADEIANYLRACKTDETKAFELNTLLTQSIISQGIATGQDTRALTAALHLMASTKGINSETKKTQYGPLIQAHQTKDHIDFQIDIPTRLTAIGRMKSLHKGVQTSLTIIGNGQVADVDMLAKQLAGFSLILGVDHCINMAKTNVGKPTPYDLCYIDMQLTPSKIESLYQ